MSKKHFKTITSNYIQPEQYVDFLVFLRIQLKKNFYPEMYGNWVLSLPKVWEFSKDTRMVLTGTAHSPGDDSHQFKSVSLCIFPDERSSTVTLTCILILEITQIKIITNQDFLFWISTPARRCTSSCWWSSLPGICNPLCMTAWTTFAGPLWEADELDLFKYPRKHFMYILSLIVVHPLQVPPSQPQWPDK